MPAISVLIKPASGSCNMHCDYCFYCDEQKNRQTALYGFMSDRTLKNVIKRTLLRAEGSYSLAFQGGEPTLCGIDFFRNAVKYVRQYNRNQVRVSLALQTNGYGITEEWAKLFAEEQFLIGISVDGLERIHSTYRHGNDGGDSWQHAMNAIRLFHQYGVEFNILTVVHRETAENIREIYRFYRANGWNFMQFITCLDPLGEPRGGKPWSLLPKTYGQFLIDLFDLWDADFLHEDQPFIRQFDNYVGILLGFEPESCEQRGICGIQNVVEADGSVYPCDFYVLDDYRLGNLNEDLLPAIYAARERMGYVARSQNHPDKCRSCRWLELCRGGCYRSRMTAADEMLAEAGLAGASATSASETAESTEGLNYFCEGYQMFFEACYDKLVKVAETARQRMHNP